MKLTLGLIVVAICLILAWGRGGNGLPMSPSQKFRDLEQRVFAMEHQIERIERNLDRATLERARD